MSYTMRTPCPCSSTEGEIRARNGQDCVFCLGCGRHCYNAPKKETGKPQRRLRDRDGMDPSQRARILERDGARCAICGATSETVILHVGHVLSVSEGRDVGASDSELNDDENLLTMCESCNLGLGTRSLPLRLALFLIRAARRRAA